MMYVQRAFKSVKGVAQKKSVNSDSIFKSCIIFAFWELQFFLQKLYSERQRDANLPIHLTFTMPGMLD